MTKIRGAVLALSALLCVGQAEAGDVRKANALYNDGKFKEAFEAFRPLAEGGDAAAQFSIGAMYRDGEGVERDDAEAFRWFLTTGRCAKT